MPSDSVTPKPSLPAATTLTARIVAVLSVLFACGRLVGIAPTASTLAEDGLAPLPSPWPPADAVGVRNQLLEELRTVTLKNCTLKRYGGAHDGGYLMCENLAARVQSAYSYGIGTEDAWGCDVARQFGVPIHQYDCFTDDRPACDGGVFIFHDECVGPTAEARDGRTFDSIAAHVARNGDTRKRLLVKIDVEGAEWDALMATPDDVLDRIVQMPMEFHGTNEVKFVELVRRLKRKFYLVNLHFNNHACDDQVRPLPAWAFQVLWVSKRVGVRDRNGPSPAPMSPLNAPDNPFAAECPPYTAPPTSPATQAPPAAQR